jgi:hypothetical protein
MKCFASPTLRCLRSVYSWASNSSIPRTADCLSTAVCIHHHSSLQREVGSGAAKREAREKLMEAARRRVIDVVLVWRLDRWGRSVTDLLVKSGTTAGLGFVRLNQVGSAIISFAGCARKSV